MSRGAILKAFEIGLHFEAVGPFLFAAHHHEHYPKGKEDMSPDASLAGRNLGMDFDTSKPWRMYHGTTVPGFPQHPHRGFETVTLVRKGYVDHSDSLGATARFGQGDVQWLTTGGGINHSEMFPLVHMDKENPTELFQLWLNLPAKSKMVPAYFKMLWAHTLPTSTYTDSKGNVTTATHVAGAPLFPGSTFKATVPPPDSWAADPANGVRIVLMKIPAHATLIIPAASAEVERGVYAFESKGFTINGLSSPKALGMHVDPTAELTIRNGDGETEILLLEGKPIDEPVVKHGPFVLNTHEQLVQTIQDYQRTGFGGWKWSSTAPVHPRDAGRFAQHADGTIERP